MSNKSRKGPKDQKGTKELDDNTFGVSADQQNKQVVFSFGKPVAWFALSPNQALAYAESIRQKAHLCQQKGKIVET